MELNQECILLRNELSKFAQQVILDKADELDKACTMPLDIVKQLAEMGILGAIIPETMGGAALNLIGLVVSLEEIGKVCPSSAIIIATHNAFFVYPILKFGTDEQKKKYLPPAVTGDIVGGFALTHTNEVELAIDGENMRIKGKNPFVLSAEANGPFTTFVQTGENNETTSTIIDQNTPGITRNKAATILGLKAAGIGEIIYSDVSIVPSAVIGKPQAGQEIFRATNDFAKVCLAAILLGIARGASEEAIKYAKERIQFNQPIINFGMVREKIAEMALQIEAARLLTYEAAFQYDVQKDYRRTAAMAKFFTGQAAVEITTQAIQIFGGYGYMKDYPIERYFRDAQVINVLCSTPADEKELIAKETIG
jgi:alkylation response protein AidB-like acyl-CoA dehydrogenase